MRIRPFREADRDTVIALWHRTGLVRPWNDPCRDLDRKLADSAWGMLVATDPVPTDPATRPAPGSPGEASQRPVGAMMVGYDGHRGSIYYLAVDPDHQGTGIGTALVRHAEEILLARGCPKINISVRADNRAAVGFYERHGFHVEGEQYAVTLGLRLVDDGPAAPT